MRLRPVARDVDAAGDPHALVRLHVVEEALQRAEAPGPAEQPAVHADAEHLRPVEPGRVPKLDPELLHRFPEGYRHLAYAQAKIGYAVKPDMPGLTGPELEDVYRRGAAWLNGAV